MAISRFLTGFLLLSVAGTAGQAPRPSGSRPAAIEQTRILAAIKEYALNYVKSLPNYVCVQTTKRTITMPHAVAQDNIREMLTFSDHKESYKVETINGKPAAAIDHDQLPGTVSSGEFGAILSHTFDAAVGTTFAWEQEATLRGKRVHVFVFRVPRTKGYSLYDGRSQRGYVSAYKGLIYADQDTQAIMRIKMDCEGIPTGFPIQDVSLTLDYNPTKIAGQEYMLPFSFELRSTQYRAITINQASYALYRKFDAESTVQFDEADVPESPGKEQK